MTMATVNFAKMFLVLHLASLANAGPCSQSMNIFSNGERILVQNLSACSESVVVINGEKVVVPPLSRAQRLLHHVARRSTATTEQSDEGLLDGIPVLRETGKLLRTTAELPAETLKIVRLVAVPLLNTTLALPVNILEGVAAMSLRGMKERARDTGNEIWRHFASMKHIPHHSLIFHKNITLGPFSLRKILEIGTFARKPATTPPPSDAISTTPPPAVVAPAGISVVTEGIAPVTYTPAPALSAAAVSSTPAPKIVVTESIKPAVVVPAPVAPVASVPVAPIAPVVAQPGVVLPATLPKPPKKVCPSQIAVVQDSGSTAEIAENSI